MCVSAVLDIDGPSKSMQENIFPRVADQHQQRQSDIWFAFYYIHSAIVSVVIRRGSQGPQLGMFSLRKCPQKGLAVKAAIKLL